MSFLKTVGLMFFPLPSIATCRCTVWGDPHYTTFDNVKYDFQGDCEYTVLKPCEDSEHPDFEVIGNNRKNTPTSKMSYLREVRLVYGGKEYELLQDGVVLVDGAKEPLPYDDDNGVHISKPGNTVRLSYFDKCSTIIHT